MMTFDDKLAEIYDIPFPAVSNKFKEEKGVDQMVVSGL